jgi:nucleoside phosphorylase
MCLQNPVTSQLCLPAHITPHLNLSFAIIHTVTKLLRKCFLLVSISRLLSSRRDYATFSDLPYELMLMFWGRSCSLETIQCRSLKMKRSRPRAQDFRIGWITALPVDLAAARAMLDEEYDDESEITDYFTGRIGNHNIVLISLPAGQIGTAAAATIAAELKFRFPELRIGLLVGIGGGVPSDEADIRLGDVVVSQPHGGFGGVVQDDFGKTSVGGRSRRTGHLNAPPEVLLRAVARMRSNMMLQRSTIGSSLSRLACFPIFDKRNAGLDVLFRCSYPHVGGSTCDACCKGMSIDRDLRESGEPVIHYGTIASGNQVIKDGVTRDTLSAELGGVLCFEMEAAGIMNIFPSLVVRGICDYADSHKHKKWQPYAAATARCLRERDPPMCAVASIAPSDHGQNDNSRLTNRTVGPDRQMNACWPQRQNTGPQHQRRRALELVPPQISLTDIVILNDALGETYHFSLNLIVSVEV